MIENKTLAKLQTDSGEVLFLEFYFRREKDRFSLNNSILTVKTLNKDSIHKIRIPFEDKNGTVESILASEDTYLETVRVLGGLIKDAIKYYYNQR